MTTAFRRSFQHHPYRLAVLAVAAAAILGAGWYLGSPLFLRSYANEALPAVAAPTAVVTAAPAAAQPVAVAPVPAAVTAPQDVAKGELGFVDSLHNGKGEVRVVQLGTAFLVRFESVTISNAPDIRIYLSTDTGGRYVEANSLYLGVLKATNGSFNYEVPAGTDISQYKSVVVWCRNFSTLITWADLH
ncbi:MAG: hypothetical protein NVS9B6_01810 [Candidatus Limnocylindrales bacterium]